MINIILKIWGQYKEFFRNRHCVMKELLIKSGESISYQYHNHRHEFWYVALGDGVVTINDMDIVVKHGSTFNILIGDKHRVRNTGIGDLIIYEMQYGPKCDEDDIIRLQDDYGRADEKPK